ncbi:uncharacterized protein LOC129407873 isoform X2 [Boleophthalmus pectinirostris]|uniref:uncharacterized protein LOC129407873 isoform X2 n=1 Tax=Boleophthalmus pectinirostris TaxID=150288 RepID=UPI00242F6353|nr:uncharacterized protein LOC129407873 isoform X2 [Boleophthalmus pectinirostris]
MTTKGQGAVPPDCGPSGVPNGQWMKIPRPEYGTYAGAGSSPHTKGYGAGVAGPSGYSSKTNGFGAAAGGYSNGGATPSQGTRAYAGTGQNNGFGAGLGYPYGGKPGYGQGSYLGAGYGDAGKSQSGNVGGVQPDYASLQGQGVPSVQGKSGMASKPSPYTGELLVPGGIDGINRFQPQAAGYGKVGSAYGGMGGLPQNPKFGIGGLQFGGNPSAANGAGKYGSASGGSYGPATRGKSGKYGSANGQQHLNLGNAANTPGKYGYGRMPYEIQTARQNPKVKSTSKHGSAYQPESAAMGQSGKATGQYDNLGGSQIPYTPQAFGAGGVAKSSGKYGAQNGYKSQHLETSTVRSEEASLPYDSLPVESATGAKSYVKGESPTPAAAVEGASVDRFDNVGYISGQVQPEESQVASQGLEQTDDVQQMPQQIHIQQQLKLHFHPQGGNDGKYDLNGFFGNANGNSGYKGINL